MYIFPNAIYKSEEPLSLRRFFLCHTVVFSVCDGEYFARLILLSARAQVSITRLLQNSLRLHGVVPPRKLCLEVGYLEFGFILAICIVERALLEAMSLGKLHVPFLLSRDEKVLHVSLELKGVGLRIHVRFIHNSRGVLENVCCHAMNRDHAFVLWSIPYCWGW